MTLPRPDTDLELRALLDGLPLTTGLSAEQLGQLRAHPSPPVESFVDEVERHEVTVPALDGTPIPLTVLRPPGAVNAPCVYWLHGGGLVLGDRFAQIDIPLEWLTQLGAVVVTVDYRLAPEHTGATALEDCFLGLSWVRAHTADLGVDPGRVVVAGASAGGGLAAGVALLVRDRQAPALAAQVLIGPMLDHRNNTRSSWQYAGEPGIWTREKSQFGWRALLGDGPVPPHVSPALTEDLSGLPPAYLDGGTAEVFRDEIVDYASRIWAVGGQAELHLWDGGSHGFDAMFPHTDLGTRARRTRTAWLARRLGQTMPAA
ncbi:acetyl esterase/lipase [Crossiella equi]|uniref:Acetyl esterase/lipase n=1 Tax=Crossiella equi TaxID=130796 RepID=A0ABS5AQ97_9PSEU|nr:alpha/beta hydrolase [Crossiella equi]MBP2478611.1 acetyl esterase/lipase [Crossiella equi]